MDTNERNTMSNNISDIFKNYKRIAIIDIVVHAVLSAVAIPLQVDAKIGETTSNNII